MQGTTYKGGRGGRAYARARPREAARRARTALVRVRVRARVRMRACARGLGGVGEALLELVQTLDQLPAVCACARACV